MTRRERVKRARAAVAQRNRNLSPRRRKAIARKAALVRWGSQKHKQMRRRRGSRPPSAGYISK